MVDSCSASKLGRPLELVTNAGDILIVPSQWAHATINAQAGIAVAVEMLYKPHLVSCECRHIDVN